MSSKPLDLTYYEVAAEKSLAARLMHSARLRMFYDFLNLASPTPRDTILDVGVSDAEHASDNMLERLYPWRERITGAGLADGASFLRAHPQCAYLPISTGEQLPARDGQFDLVVSNAVIEHVGGYRRQQAFVRELIRVARRGVFLSMPNRYFPVEHHTALPLVAWSDATFRLACRLTGKAYWGDVDHLRLMSPARLREILPMEVAPIIRHAGIRLGPWSSNLVAWLPKTE